MLDFKIIKLDIVCDINELREYFETVKKDFQHLRWDTGDRDVEAGYGTKGHSLKGVHGWAIDHNGVDLHAPCAPFEVEKRKLDFYRETELNFGFMKKMKRIFPSQLAQTWAITCHPPGAKLAYHIDQAEFIKVHIPIDTNDNAIFYYRDEEFNMKADGSMYLVNTMIEHGTDNRGDTIRNHLMFNVDYKSVDMIKALKGHV